MRKFLAIALAAALVVPIAAANAGSANDRATGGGQIFVTFGEDETTVNEPVEGAGDTIAFTAQESADGVRGQVQIVERSGGTGKGGLKLHGVVTCLTVMDNVARIGGTATRTDSEDRTAFELLVTDNGEGAAAAADTISLAFVDTPECSEDNEDDDNQTTLARGNVQVYDAPEPE